MCSMHRESSLRAAGVLPPLPVTAAPDTPLTRLTVPQLDACGAALLPEDEPEPDEAMRVVRRHQHGRRRVLLFVDVRDRCDGGHMSCYFCGLPLPTTTAVCPRCGWKVGR